MSPKKIGDVRSSVFTLRSISVCAVYPTFAILAWEIPHASEASLLTDRILWHYTVEWNCSCYQSERPRSAYANVPFMAITIPHPGEIVYVRVVARGALGSDSLALTSAKTSFSTQCTVGMPWLPRASLCESSLLFDCLLLCANSSSSDTASGSHLFNDREDILHSTVEGHYVLTSGVTVSATTMRYASTQPPMTAGPLIYVMAVCSTSPQPRAKQLTVDDIHQMITTSGNSVIVCGIGQLGVSAALETYALFAALLPLCEDTRHRLFCISYGSPRCTMLDLPHSTLEMTAHVSGNFLTYSGTLAPPDSASGFANTLFSAGSHAKEENTTLSVPLGVRCGPLMDVETGRMSIIAEASSGRPMQEEERFECLDVAYHLQLLQNTLAPAHQLSPLVSSARGYIDSTSTLVIEIVGKNLQYNATVTCICGPGDAPVALQISSSTPSSSLLTGRASSIACLCTVCHYSLCAPSSIRVQVLIHTDFGFAESIPFSIDVPTDIGNLLFHASRSQAACSMPNAWVSGYPSALLHALLSMLPLLSSQLTPTTTTTTTELLCSLASTAEVAAHYAKSSGGQLSGFFSFVTSVTSRVASASRPPQHEGGDGGATPALSLPSEPREAPFLERCIKKMMGGSIDVQQQQMKVVPLSTFVEKVEPWRRRILTSVPALRDGSYRVKLQWLLLMLQEKDVGRELPLPALELMLYRSTLIYLHEHYGSLLGVHGSDHGGKERGFLCRVVGAITFAKFYECTYALFQHIAVTSSSDRPEVEVVAEIAFLWSVLAIVQLRLQSLLSHVVAVTGCRGSGCSTIIKELLMTSAAVAAQNKSTSAETHKKAHGSLVIVEVPEYRLEILREALRLGMRTSVFVMGELPDMSSMAYAAVANTLRTALSDAQTQHVHLLATKIDEHMHSFFPTPAPPRSSNNNSSNSSGRGGGSAATVRAEDVLSLASETAASSTHVEMGSVHAVALAPSLHHAQQFVVLCHLTGALSAADLVASLRDASRRTVWDLVYSSKGI